jgi:hypothetical protein
VHVSGGLDADSADDGTLLWSYETAACESAGALPPESMRLHYGERDPQSPYSSRDYATIWRAIENGYQVKPSDCPPIRLIARYGVIVRCPGTVVLRRLERRASVREFEPGCARFGIAEVAGDTWPVGDSGFVASWIAGSEFVKIQTGIVMFFPKRYCLYQGPLPNRTLIRDADAEVMAGVEYAVPSRIRTIDARRYGVADMNVIVRLPPAGTELRLPRGAALAWVCPLLPVSSVRIMPLPSGGRGG